MNLPTLVLAASCCFVSGMLVEAVVWGRAARRYIERLHQSLDIVRGERDRWQRAALLRSGRDPESAAIRARWLRVVN